LRGANETSRGYRPVTVLSYALVYHGIGKAREQAARLAEDPKAAEVSAHPQHLLNVLIQVLNTWLLWLLLVRVAGGGWPALVGTLVFGVHAIHSGPVASIVGRGELLAFSFGAAAAVLYLDGVRSATPGTSWRAAGLLVGSAVLLWLAFCAKESALAWVFFLPCLRLAQHWGSARDQDTTHRLRRDLWLWPAVVVLPVVCFVWLYVRTVWHLDYLPSYLGNPLLHGPAAERFMTAPMLWGYGLYKVLLPFSLACDYSTATFELVRSPWDPRLLGALVVLVGILWAGLRCARRHPLVFLAMASFLGFSFIVSNVPFGLETIFAERLYYTPSVATSFLVVWLLQRGFRDRARWLVWVVLATWLAASAWTTVYRMGVWQDNYSLFTHDAKVQPRSLSMLQTAAGQYDTHGQQKEYEDCIDRILRIEPWFPFGLKARAKLRVAAGDLDGALEFLRRGLDSPLLMLVNKADDVPELHHDTAVVLALKGRHDEARKRFHECLELSPRYHPAREKLIRMALEASDPNEAQRLLAAGEGIDAAHDPWKIYGGVLAYQRGDYPKAVRLLEDILPRAPMQHLRFTDWMALADALGRVGRKRDALRWLDHGIQMGSEVPPEHKQAVRELRRYLSH
jgi:tetratricopeptide (TPR) repeat protein